MDWPVRTFLRLKLFFKAAEISFMLYSVLMSHGPSTTGKRLFVRNCYSFGSKSDFRTMFEHQISGVIKKKTTTKKC